MYLRNSAMGRMLEPVYINMKKKAPVEKILGSCGLSWGRGEMEGGREREGETEGRGQERHQ